MELVWLKIAKFTYTLTCTSHFGSFPYVIIQCSPSGNEKRRKPYRHLWRGESPVYDPGACVAYNTFCLFCLFDKGIFCYRKFQRLSPIPTNNAVSIQCKNQKYVLGRAHWFLLHLIMRVFIKQAMQTTKALSQIARWRVSSVTTKERIHVCGLQLVHFCNW